MARIFNSSILLMFTFTLVVSCNSGGDGSGGSDSKAISGALSVKELEVNNLNSSVSGETYKLSGDDLAYLQNEGIVSSSKAKKLEKIQN